MRSTAATLALTGALLLAPAAPALAQQPASHSVLVTAASPSPDVTQNTDHSSKKSSGGWGLWGLAGLLGLLGLIPRKNREKNDRDTRQRPVGGVGKGPGAHPTGQDPRP